MKKTIILSMIIITILQVGCSNKDTETINSNEIRTEENNKEDIVEENYTVFNYHQYLLNNHKHFYLQINIFL